MHFLSFNHPFDVIWLLKLLPALRLRLHTGKQIGTTIGDVSQKNVTLVTKWVTKRSLTLTLILNLDPI